MAVVSNASVRISAFSWVPEFARGFVRDLRVRWALEEAGIDYSERLLDGRLDRPVDYLSEQPFGQVPSYVDKGVVLFESGAIVLHIGETCDALLPNEPAERARAIAWVFAALNSVEPWTAQLGALDAFHAGEAWTKERRPQLEKMAARRLDNLEAHLGDRPWLENRFTAGDLTMSAVLRDSDFASARPRLAAYRARCEGRPAFKRALAAQMAAFEPAKASSQ